MTKLLDILAMCRVTMCIADTEIAVVAIGVR